MANKLLVALFFSLFVTAAVATTRMGEGRRSDAQQCRLQRLRASQPSHRIESEGGVTELWDKEEDQFQCAGVAPMRNRIRPNSLSLPNYHPYPRLVYIEQGEGLMGIHFPGCALTYESESQQSQRERGEESREQERQRGQGRQQRGQSQERGSRDQHMRIHRFRQGDIVAIPAGAVHWTYNDGNEELVAVSINDLNNPANQLDQQPRSFYLAGGIPRQGMHGQQGRERGQQDRQRGMNFQKIFSGFDPQLLAEAFDVDEEVVRRMQRPDERGLIVNVNEEMRSIIRAEEQQQQQYRGSRQEEWGYRSNGLEEVGACSAKIRYNLDNEREADIVSRHAGRINIANVHTLHILGRLDLAAEKGNLLPNALETPHWSLNSHSIVYVTRGDAHVQIVSNDGESIFNDRVNEGDMFVVPQFYTKSACAGQNGFEWVAFKTSRSPMKSPLAGQTSVIRAMPLQVLTNAFQISPSQAQNLKYNRRAESYLMSPRRGKSY